METNELKRDIIDGKIIDWSKLSKDELITLKDQFKKKEKGLLKKINDELSSDNDAR